MKVLVRKRNIVSILILLVVIVILLSIPYILRWLFPISYGDVVYECAAKHGLDPYLIFSVIKVESGFDEEAVSARGALGLMQVMPETGKWIACETSMESFKEEELLIPEKNIRIGSWYLKKLLKEFDDLPGALAAYNAGPGNVQRWIELGVWDGSRENVDNIPYSETEDYVIKVLNTYKVYKGIYN